MKPLSCISVLTAVLLLLIAGSSCDSSFNTIPASFNENWLFIQQDSANADKILPGIIPNHKWEEVSLPHTASLEPLNITGRQWTGICWYKKIYHPGRKQRHKHTGLLFDGAMHNTIVYLNGVEIASHSGGYTPFYVNLTDDLLYGKENEIMVKLDNREESRTPPGMAAGEHSSLWYSGLYRNVSIYITDKLRLTNHAEPFVPNGGGIIISVTEVSRESATLTITAHITNDDRTPRSYKIKNSLLDAAGLEVASSLSAVTELEPGQNTRQMTRIIVMQPALWSPEAPFLYTVRTELLSEGDQPIDRRETRTGIRSVKVTRDRGMLLNGEVITLRGTNRYQEYPYIGFALSDNAGYRDAFKIKEAGFNIVRTPDYPPSPAFLDACDELGLMVIDAIPVLYSPGDTLPDGTFERSTRMLCRRDRNHPSIVMWEAPAIASDLPFSLALRQTLMEELPKSNSITCSMTDAVFDVYAPPYHHYSALRNRTGAGHTRPLFISEYGGYEEAAIYNVEPGSENGERDTITVPANYYCMTSDQMMTDQAYRLQEGHNENLSAASFGDAAWLMFDYNRGKGNGIDNSGIMNIFRLPKYAYWFYRSQDERGPVCFIAHHNLPFSGNRVTVYSNADSVRLSRNDTLIAVQGPDRDSNSLYLTHPPFTFTLTDTIPGTLQAVALKRGSETASYSVTTPGSPVALRLLADLNNKPLQADGADVIFIHAHLADSAGNLSYCSDREVEFIIRGNAELIGDNPVRAESGIASILLRAKGNPGKIMIRASSEGMTRAEMMTESK